MEDTNASVARYKVKKTTGQTAFALVVSNLLFLLVLRGAVFVLNEQVVCLRFM
jgi:hypothetical protein